MTNEELKRCIENYELRLEYQKGAIDALYSAKMVIDSNYEDRKNKVAELRGELLKNKSILDDRIASLVDK